eukprot:gene7199-6801_t
MVTLPVLLHRTAPPAHRAVMWTHVFHFLVVIMQAFVHTARRVYIRRQGGTFTSFPPGGAADADGGTGIIMRQDTEMTEMPLLGSEDSTAAGSLP